MIPASISPGARLARQRRVARQLIELHRLEQLSHPVPLSELQLDTFLRTICRDHPEVELSIREPSHPVLSHPGHLARLLLTVLDNAHLHGAPPVRVHLEQGRIVITDTGPGFPQRLLAHATERFVTGSPANGVGLGLALAAHHAGVIGATLQIRNLASAGAEVTITP